MSIDRLIADKHMGWGMWRVVKGAADLAVTRPSSGASRQSRMGFLGSDACCGSQRDHAERLLLLAPPFVARQSAAPKGRHCCRWDLGFVVAAAVAQAGVAGLVVVAGLGLRVRYVVG